ncbi:hypothetical protein DR950_41790 [Kitasatospora xanthocidica]|uniref:Uncharacterized protein n=1 Tax=Kitasatospora xanthocidica TaxID=83382 RepID=A0A372ZHT7_9ACTN|nr:hypothetical protein [Kitasatospora xanthocidica]RGD55398.1 hypothetical protein DR950_41790 [Kitasatospora xanthocidica]
MDTTPADVRDQHITDLRAALTRAVQELSFAAGREVADDPGYSDRLMTIVGSWEETLARTAS